MIPSRIKLAVLVWLVLEVLAFSLVAHWIGVPRAILLGVITSLLGLTLLRRAGTSALRKLRAGFDGRLITERDTGRFLDEMLATAGALALLLPGFLSDVVGLALAAPACRDRAARWIERGGLAGPRDNGAHHGPTTIDLEPEEWRHTEGGSRPVTKTWSP